MREDFIVMMVDGPTELVDLAHASPQNARGVPRHDGRRAHGIGGPGLGVLPVLPLTARLGRQTHRAAT